MNNFRNSRIRIFTLIMTILMLTLLACGTSTISKLLGSDDEPSSVLPTEAVTEPTEPPTAEQEEAEPTGTPTPEQEAESETTAADSVEIEASEPDSPDTVDLKPYVHAFLVTYDVTCCNGKVIDEIDILFNADQVQFLNDYPHPRSDTFNMTGACRTIFAEYICVSAGTEEEIPDKFTLNISEGEIELTQPDASATTGPFFIEISRSDLVDKETFNRETFLASLNTPLEPDLSNAVDLAPYVTALTVDVESIIDNWNGIDIASHFELIFDSVQVQILNPNPNSTSRDARNYAIINPAGIPIVMVESSFYDVLDVNVWLAEPIAETVTFYIAAGEFEATLPDGQTTDGPFVVQVANATSNPQLVAVTDPAALAAAGESTTPAESADSDSASTGDQLPSSSAAGDSPLFPIVKGRKWGFMNQAGEVVIEPQFTGVHRFNFPTFEESLEPVNVGKGADAQWGFIDKSGQFIIEPQFGDAKQFSEGLARVRIGEKYGYINPAGETVIEPQFDGSGPFTNGAAYAKIGETFTFIDTTGQPLSNLRFDDIGWFFEGLAPVKTGNKWGFIDKSGQFVIEPQFDKVREFSEGLAAVQSGDRVQYIDSSGQVVLDPPIDGAGYFSFSEGLAAVKVGAKYGFMDKSGQMVIEPQFDNFESFSEGLAGVEIAGTYGYIDPDGQMVFQLEFDFPVDPDRAVILGDFYEGLAMIKVDGKFGYVDRAGNFVWEPTD